MLVSIHFIVHNVIVVFGIFINITSIFIILRKTPTALKVNGIWISLSQWAHQEYSVLLLNTAITELFSVNNHLLVDGRLFYSSSIAICISNGPCRFVSDTFCAILTAVMNVVMVHCTGLVALSFWYRQVLFFYHYKNLFIMISDFISTRTQYWKFVVFRARILSGKPLMGKRRLQFLSTSLFIPHISYILAYFFTMTPREILSEKLKPFHNVTGCGLYGEIMRTRPRTRYK